MLVSPRMSAVIFMDMVYDVFRATYCARAASLFPRKLCAPGLCVLPILFWRIKSQQQLPAVNFKKVKTYKGKLGPEKSELGD